MVGVVCPENEWDVWVQKQWKGWQKRDVRGKHISGHLDQEKPALRLKQRTNCKWGVSELFIAT